MLDFLKIKLLFFLHIADFLHKADELICLIMDSDSFSVKLKCLFESFTSHFEADMSGIDKCHSTPCC